MGTHQYSFVFLSVFFFDNIMGGGDDCSSFDEKYSIKAGVKLVICVKNWMDLWILLLLLLSSSSFAFHYFVPLFILQFISLKYRTILLFIFWWRYLLCYIKNSIWWEFPKFCLLSSKKLGHVFQYDFVQISNIVN